MKIALQNINYFDKYKSISDVIKEIKTIEKFEKITLTKEIHLNPLNLILQYSNDKEKNCVIHGFVNNKLFDKNVLGLIYEY
jgi:hypothetical protein